VPIAMGLDAQNGIYTDMFEAGIIDPTKVTRTGMVVDLFS
jgi:chaperonin GroEL (HSP60 family)